MTLRGRLVVLVAFLAAALSLWQAAAPFFARVAGQGEASARGFGTGAVVAAGEMRVDLSPVLAFAPFGLAEAAAPQAVREGAVAELRLLGITVAVPKSGSRAIIAGGDVPVASYGIAADISSGIELRAVFQDHVVLGIDGREAVLTFAVPGSGSGSGPGPGSGIAASGAGTDGVDLLNLTAGNVPAAGRQDLPADTWLGRTRAEIEADAPGLLRRLGLAPAEGGYLVTEAALPEVVQAGFRPGDLLRAVNGAALGDPAADAALFDAVASAGRASFSVLRAGETITMTFPLK